MSGLTHFDAAGNAVMVDVGAKPETDRAATAKVRVSMRPETLRMIVGGTAQKGDVFGVARIAGIMAAKRTAELIPLCHPLALTAIGVEFAFETGDNRVRCTVTAETTGPTGVEMEALTAVQIGLLTIYDMCKAIDRGMTMGDVRLLEKQGGAGGTWTAP